ncbi:MAG: CoA-binding protein [Planctomycetota bacterium]
MPQPSVAIVGASADPDKYGNRSLHAHLEQGYQVYPINPKGGEIDGVTVYRSLSEVPVDRLDRVSLYVPPKVGAQLLEEIAAKGCDELWLNPGSESEQLIDQARTLGLEPIVACSIVDVKSRPRVGGE